MFGTWKYDPETDEVQNLRRAYDPVTARSSQHQACNRCHEKKLKCSGQKEGCERCIAHNLTCEYTRSSSRGSKKAPKTGRRQSGGSSSSLREDSPVSTHANSVSRSSASASKSHSKNSKSRSTSRAVATTTAGPSYATTSGAYSRGITATAPARMHSGEMLDSLDFSGLGPGDGFDMRMLSSQQHAYSNATTSGGYATATTAYAQPAMSQGYQTWSTTPQYSSAAVQPNVATAGQGYYEYEQYYEEEEEEMDPRMWSQHG